MRGAYSPRGLRSPNGPLLFWKGENVHQVVRPVRPQFSSGPCAKRPGWSTDVLKRAYVGRSHRSAEGKERLAEVISLTKTFLGLPEDYLCGIVPASDTGAVRSEEHTSELQSH